MIKQCLVCNKDIKVKPSHFDKVFCCSNECRGKRQSLRQLGENNANYKDVMSIQKICAKCGVEFKPGFHHSTAKYCGYSCAGKVNGTAKKKFPNRKKTIYLCDCGNKKEKKSKFCSPCHWVNVRTLINCKFCGNKFIKGQNKMFCSTKCMGLDRKESNKGDKNPNWQGGKVCENHKERTSDKYKLWRISVYKRDEYTCRECGQVGGVLHAHHVKSFSKNPELRTDIDNGLTLCFNCHSKYHPQLKKFKNDRRPNTGKKLPVAS